MQKHHGEAVGVAAFLDVKLVDVIDAQSMGAVRLDLGI
jgi:hypothetical protein